MGNRRTVRLNSAICLAAASFLFASDLSFGLSSSDSEKFAPQILEFLTDANEQRPFASPKISRDASTISEREGGKHETQILSFLESDDAFLAPEAEEVNAQFVDEHVAQTTQPLVPQATTVPVTASPSQPPAGQPTGPVTEQHTHTHSYQLNTNEPEYSLHYFIPPPPPAGEEVEGLTNTHSGFYYHLPSNMQHDPSPIPTRGNNNPNGTNKSKKDAYMGNVNSYDEPTQNGGRCGSESVMQNTYSMPQSQPPQPTSTPPAAEKANGTNRPEGQIQSIRTLPNQSLYPKPDCGPAKEGYTVNFEDISVIQLIQFISRISGSNYIFDSKDLQFNITIVSEEQTSVEDLSAALLQVLKMYGLSVSEQGNNVLIYRDQNLSKVSTVVTDETINLSCDNAIITRVFRVYNIDVTRVAEIVKTLISPQATVEPSVQTGHLVVTDITANVNKISDLISALDSPNISIDIAEYEVKNAHPVALAEYAKEILAPFIQGSATFALTPEPGSQKIFIVASPFLLQKTKQILTSLDLAEVTEETPLVPSIESAHVANNNFYMYKLKYQNGQFIAEAMREIGLNLQATGIANVEFTNTIHSLQWIHANNSIIITGTDAVIEKVVELLDDLDQPPKQVYVEVLILDTTLANSLDFGVQWIALGDEQDKLAFASGLLGNSPPGPNLQGGSTTNPGARYIAANPAANPPTIPNAGRDVPLPVPSSLTGLTGIVDSTSAFGFGIIGNILRHNGKSFLTLGALVSALDEERDTTIVLNPKIMVEDTQTASFFVGQNIPYQTTSTVIQQTGSVTQNIQYEDIGVQLRVTPTISPNNVVTLQIDQTVEEVDNTGSSGLTPTTNKTLATTRVHVPDGTFLVMSGHVRDRCDYVRSGVPCLGTLPLIGPTFSRTIEQRQKRNLIFFIRPKVITTIEEGIEVTNHEGYEYNYESDPCSIIDCDMKIAPECEEYPPYRAY